MRTESSSGFLGAVSSVLGEGHECVALARGQGEAAFAILAAWAGKKAAGILKASEGGESYELNLFVVCAAQVRQLLLPLRRELYEGER